MTVRVSLVEMYQSRQLTRRLGVVVGGEDAVLQGSFLPVAAMACHGNDKANRSAFFLISMTSLHPRSIRMPWDNCTIFAKFYCQDGRFWTTSSWMLFTSGPEALDSGGEDTIVCNT